MVLLVFMVLASFQFRHLGHVGIFLETCLFIVTAFSAVIAFPRSPSPRHFLFVAASACLAALTYWLWSLPAARGLIH